MEYKKFSTRIIGDGIKSSVNINHKLNDRIYVEVRHAETKGRIFEFGITQYDSDNVTLDFPQPIPNDVALNILIYSIDEE
jgi:hypothetical protein